MKFLFALLSLILLYSVQIRSISHSKRFEYNEDQSSPHIVYGEYDKDISDMTYSKWKRYCQVDEEWFERNEAAFGCAGVYNAFLGVFVKLPGASSDRNLTFVADIPYTIVTKYYETACKFVFVLHWYVVCDSVSCPLLTPGLYLAVQETFNKIKVDEPIKDDESRYIQGYSTPVIPGNPDQTQWIDVHILIQTHWFVGLYKNLQGNVTYEEFISVDIPHGHISHSAQSYTQGAQYNSSYVYMTPWIDLDYYVAIGGLSEPANSTHTLFINNRSAMYTEFATGQFAYMVLIAPASGKRTNDFSLSQTDYDKAVDHATNAKNRNIFPKGGF